MRRYIEKYKNLENIIYVNILGRYHIRTVMHAVRNYNQIKFKYDLSTVVEIYQSLMGFVDDNRCEDRRHYV